ncbi:hypothetical protein DSM112329_03699 [Paraconexibacter sp. AEG42_29]|uniref:Secreted protein n=1 Tax=Paraconexibacter sp. AEG42_29 TaxID=2997339 RepID=A0AAU7AYN2_9ACTN
MRAPLVAVATTLVLLCAGAGTGTGQAAIGIGRDCGELRRPYTDARVAVTVTKGSAACKTARGVLTAYWRASPGAAARTRTVTYRGNRWRCVPQRVMSGARAWGCSTARERTIVAASEVG